jgi:hypothetical protein
VGWGYPGVALGVSGVTIRPAAMTFLLVRGLVVGDAHATLTVAGRGHYACSPSPRLAGRRVRGVLVDRTRVLVAIAECRRRRRRRSTADSPKPLLISGGQLIPRSKRTQRIDRPLLPERPPSGQLVSGRRGRTGVDGPASVCGDLRSRRGIRLPTARRPLAWTRVSLRQPLRTCHLVRAPAGSDPGPLLPQATAVLVPACGPDTVAARREGATVFRRAVTGLSAVVSGRSARPCPGPATGRLRRCPGVRGCLAELWTVSGRRCPPRTLWPRHVRCYRKRSPDRRPLVGCSHRRQARRSCQVSCSRSCSRT